jgi:hypothetical protein
MSINGASVMAAAVVAVDVGKNRAALSVTDADRRRLLCPVDFAMTAPGVAAVLERVCAVLPAGAVTVGIEAAGHYHRPLLAAAVWPEGWRLLELSPARVAEQRRVQGRRRVKTDAIDLEAITELVLASHGVAVTARAAAVTELTGWSMHRSRRVQTLTATKNQVLAQLDRCFPGLTLALPDVLGTQVGRLVAAEFADPHRLAMLGVAHLSGSPATVGCGFDGRVSTGWWRPPAPRYRPQRLWWPARCWPLILPCWPTWTSRSSPRKPTWPGCRGTTSRVGLGTTSRVGLGRVIMSWFTSGDEGEAVFEAVAGAVDGHEWNANRLRLTEATAGAGGRLLVCLALGRVGCAVGSRRASR